MGHGVLAVGSTQEFLELSPIEQALTAGMVRKAKAWELEQLAKAIGGE